MSLSANTLRRLAALKLAPAAMAEVLSIIADMQAADEARKSKDRARKSRGKSRENPGNENGNGAENDTEKSGDAISLSSSNSEVSEKERKEIARGRTIPPDWTPNENHFSLGHQLGHSRDRVGEIAETMREWAAANRNRAIARKADWDKTFNGFLRREKPKGAVATSRPMNGNPRNGEVRGDQIWFHMESPEYRQRNETRTDKYCGWWFRTEAA